ncbi:MAG TPA: lysophospholipid acyltransferase family protein [Steroidobacteraceae bacterium]|nr:lysophospholipid acyltransferase family protein [Steroidobacteraceae bacterium]
MTDTGSGGGLRNTIYQQATRSRRRMTPLRRFVWRIIVTLGLGLIRFWWRTCKVVRIVGDHHLSAALQRVPSVIPVFWHQHLLFCSKYLLEQRERGVHVGFLISPSVDGELGAMAAQRLGAVAIRGSSTHTGARTLRDFYEALVKQNVSAVVTPDGPRGPRFQFKSGAIVLSQMSGRPLLPMAYAASRATTFHWDKFVLPWPFCRIAIAIGEPRQIPKQLDAAAVEHWQRELAQDLHRLYREAKATLEERQ